MTTFFSYNALVSQRAAGYKNTAYALAELIDNSFDANANDVNIILIERRISGRPKVEEIIILDDGSGMETDVLQGALQFGNTTNTDIEEVVRKRRKGKFGYGLPNASLSQCQKIGVYSWKKKEQINYVYLDLEELKKNHSIEIPAVKKHDFPSYYQELFNGLPASGTIISWQNCDRLSHVRGKSIVDNSFEILGRLYRHLLAEGKHVNFLIFEYMPTTKKYVQQGQVFKLRPNDPLFLMKDTILSQELWNESTHSGATGKSAEIYAKYVSATDKCSPTSAALDDHCITFDFRWRGKIYEFKITTSVVLPEIQMPGQRDGGSTDVGNAYRVKENIGNISFVRADREIASGSFGSFYNRTVLPNRFWSIEIKFDADADDLLGVHNNKQGIEFTSTDIKQAEDEFDEHSADLLQARNHLWIQLTERIASAIKAASRLVKKQSNDWHSVNITPGGGQSANPTIPTGTPTTGRTITKVEGTRRTQLPGPRLIELENRLIKKYPNISAEDIRSAIEDLDRSLARACVLYAPSEAYQLWSYTKVNDFIVLLINTQHEFYTKVLSELRNNGQEGALTAIELLLSSLAIEEESFVANDADKEAIESFRAAVGLKLHRYINSLPDNLSMVVTQLDMEEDND